MDDIQQALTNIPSGAWALAGGVFGSFLTFVGVWLTNRANNRRLELQLEHDERTERSKVARERLEELYVLVVHWVNAMFEDHSHLALVMKDHIDYNKYLDGAIERGKSKSVDFSRLTMIVEIYGNESRAAYERCMAALHKVNGIISAHKASYETASPTRPFLQPFADARLELNRMCEELLSSVARDARMS